MEAVPSPCNLICTLDPRTGFCRGCGRTAAEIGEWPTAAETRKREIVALLPERLATLR